MPNDYFEFKKFIIKQERCTMRVGTDAVLLGAWVNADHCKNILDIGTGTGVIALMLAQKSNAVITALEIDTPSYEQANENVTESPYSDRVKLINDSFQKFSASEKNTYDLIVSNPPFFLDSHKSNDVSRSLARHADALPFPDLIIGVKNILAPEGRFCLILPKKEAEIFIKLAEQEGFYLNRLLRVRPMIHKSEDKRFIMQFECEPKELDEDTLYIRTTDPMEYSEEYKSLTKEFYLNF
jgi:tRNA1Val (adenine37-N6)-methyltransferase